MKFFGFKQSDVKKGYEAILKSGIYLSEEAVKNQARAIVRNVLPDIRSIQRQGSSLLDTIRQSTVDVADVLVKTVGKFPFPLDGLDGEVLLDSFKQQLPTPVSLSELKTASDEFSNKAQVILEKLVDVYWIMEDLKKRYAVFPSLDQFESMEKYDGEAINALMMVCFYVSQLYTIQECDELINKVEDENQAINQKIIHFLRFIQACRGSEDQFPFDSVFSIPQGEVSIDKWRKLSLISYDNT